MGSLQSPFTWKYILAMPNENFKQLPETFYAKAVPESSDTAITLDILQKIEGLGYRFSRSTGGFSMKDGGRSYYFSCLQSLEFHNAKHGARLRARINHIVSNSVAKPHKSRQSMERFPCAGRLIVTCCETHVEVTYKHTDHAYYHDCSLPESSKSVIEKMVKSGHQLNDITRAVLDGIVGEVKFTTKTIRDYYDRLTEKLWKLDPNDPWNSIRLMGESEWRSLVSRIQMENVENIKMEAFVLSNIFKEYASKVSEVGIDSTWNTTSNNVELFVVMGYVPIIGAGVPLAFLYVKTSIPDYERRKQLKTKVLTSFLSHLRDHGVSPHTTLSDKDFAEINALKSTWPLAKHQLCYWHCNRAIKIRLCSREKAPRNYNVEEARALFSFIDSDFVPINQATRIWEDPPSTPLKPIKLRISPQYVDDVDPSSEGTESEAEKDAEDVRHIIKNTFNKDYCDMSVAEVKSVFKALSDFHEEMRLNCSDWSSDEADEFQFLELANLVVDHHQDLSSVSKRTSTAPNKTYVFCPAPHRALIMRLFSRHFCFHPLIYERDIQFTTGESVWVHAVKEMYHHCYRNRLCEVWAYLWNEWYRPGRWELWMRASRANFISEKRTTMMLESFFRALKCVDLLEVRRPRLDRLFFIMLRKTIPRTEFNYLRSNFRHIVMTSAQRAMKKSWMNLLQRRILGTYHTDVTTWSCNCGSLKYNPYLLCKHLVQQATVMMTCQYDTPTNSLTLDQRAALLDAVHGSFFLTVKPQTMQPFYNIPLYMQSTKQAGISSESAELLTSAGFPSVRFDTEESVNNTVNKEQMLATLQRMHDLVSSQTNETFLARLNSDVISPIQVYERKLRVALNLRKPRTWDAKYSVAWGYEGDTDEV
ncbi:hypothetical protein BCR33DRAFT_784343 [Rhizoclosmatium globosum]|uniref:SWIM-type domain-containing protein n=1 Tax=Rhizoclosmatium globosum TaxID=329046 RepID=A0A1Y2CET6_9FUNG|nr:hypothetical protein BCR33DRAFT_784343 [Rhizoclosmatium globosum]|eukprot:ORY45578.1 hypothetical protein BCR33DRAFT_784343 [Rhizoclosmatium globosum]